MKYTKKEKRNKKNIGVDSAVTAKVTEMEDKTR